MLAAPVHAMDSEASVPSGSSSGAVSRGARRFAKATWVVIAVNFAVIAWGGYVRASGSGAGCGKHWPTCNGEVIPRTAAMTTFVEFTHRVTSGLALLLVAALAVLAFRVFPAGHPTRRASRWSLGFMMGEALIGAGLVLFELVAHDASMKRALSMALHLTNTFFLLGALVLTALFAVRPFEVHEAGVRAPKRARARSNNVAVAYLLAAPMLGVIGVATSGAVAALGDTLFPAHSWSEGLAQDLSPTTTLLLRLRLVHPFLATATGALVLGATAAVRHLRPERPVIRASWFVVAAFLAQFGAGLLNLALLAPVATQLLHLVLADALWLTLVVFGFTALTTPATSAATAPELAAPAT